MSLRCTAYGNKDFHACTVLEHLVQPAALPHRRATDQTCARRAAPNLRTGFFRRTLPFFVRLTGSAGLARWSSDHFGLLLHGRDVDFYKGREAARWSGLLSCCLLPLVLILPPRSFLDIGMDQATQPSDGSHTPRTYPPQIPSNSAVIFTP